MAGVRAQLTVRSHRLWTGHDAQPVITVHGAAMRKLPESELAL
jgi:hypothetical protein